MPALPDLVIADLRGGRNSADDPFFLSQNQCVEALNVDWWSGNLASKRYGASAISMTFSAGGPFTGTISSVLRHVPGADETAAELWAFDSANIVGRLAGATTWTAPTVVDSTQSTLGIQGASLGGFFWICENTAQNRLHVWDASLSKLRRVGLATPSAPSAATLGGAGLSFTRYYAIRYTDVSGSDTRRRSERSASTSITITDDSGVQVTKPSGLSEDETNWEVLASDTGTAGTWYRLTTQAVGSTTYNDTNATIPTTTPDVEDGINYPPPSAKFIIAHNSRLIMAGAWETSGGYVTPKNNRIWWTPVIGANDVGDLERIPTGFYIDVPDAITGLGGPIQGNILVFCYRRILKLVPTGLPGANAFTVVDAWPGVGAVAQNAIAMGEDEMGNPALYFWAARGLYRLGVNGIQYCGNDLEDVTATINYGASVGYPVQVFYYPAKHQVWCWLATGSSNDADTKMVFDVRLGRAEGDAVLGGWSKHTSLTAQARGAVLFSNTLGASMSLDLKPYIGRSDASNSIGKCDDTSVNQDFSTSFQAYVETKDYAPWGLAMNGQVGHAFLVARVATGVTIRLTRIRDCGAETSTADAPVLTAAGSETFVRRKFDTGELAGGFVYRFRVGDSAAANNHWDLSALVVRVAAQEAA